MARAFVNKEVLEYSPLTPWAYALFPCPLQLFCLLYFGWYHEVMNQFFASTDERYTIRHLTGQVRSVIVQRTFCPLHIRYIFVLSIIHPLLIRQSPLVDRSLSVTCPLHLRYACVLCAPYTFHDDFHRRMYTGLTFFCFGVRYPYWFICDSTITV